VGKFVPIAPLNQEHTSTSIPHGTLLKESTLVQLLINAARSGLARTFCKGVTSLLTSASFLLCIALLLPMSFVNAESDGFNAHSEVDDRPVMYLTFDDGPSADSVTDEVLQVLSRYGAQATFFVTGRRVRQAREKLAEIVAAGHAIGNHTHSHNRLTLVSDEEVLAEFVRAREAILSAGGPPPRCFRPPFGSTNHRVNEIARGVGLVPVSWSVDTRDWQKTSSVSTIFQELSQASSESIVLMHDGPIRRSKTLQAFSDWMESASQIFQFHALPQCVGGSYVQIAEARLKVAKSSNTTVESTPKTESLVSSIPLLLEKIRRYKFTLQREERLGDLSHLSATLSGEIHSDHIFYAF